MPTLVVSLLDIVQITFMLWILMTCGYLTGLHTATDALLAVTMVFFASKKLTAALRVCLSCVIQVMSMIILFFTVVSIAAIFCSALYHDKLDPDTGQTLDTFFDSFISMYVFLEGADNWEDLVYNVYMQSYWGFLVFSPLLLSLPVCASYIPPLVSLVPRMSPMLQQTIQCTVQLELLTCKL